MNARQAMMFTLLAAMWGASFLFVRVAVGTLGPVVVADGRLLLAGLGLLAYAYFCRKMPTFTKPLRSYLILGSVNAAAQFTFMALAATTLSASLTAIIVATMPLWSVPVAAIWFNERPARGAIAGLIGGVLGVGLVVGVAPQEVNATFLLAVAAALASALAGAVGGNYARLSFKGESSLAQTIGQQLAAGTILLPLLAVVPPAGAPSGTEIAAMLALALLSTGVAFLIYFHLIAEIGATKTLTVEFCVPVFASLWGIVFLGEEVTIGTVMGGGIILFSCALVSGWTPWHRVSRWVRQKVESKDSENV